MVEEFVCRNRSSTGLTCAPNNSADCLMISTIVGA